MCSLLLCACSENPLKVTHAPNTTSLLQRTGTLHVPQLPVVFHDLVLMLSGAGFGPHQLGLNLCKFCCSATSVFLSHALFSFFLIYLLFSSDSFQYLLEAGWAAEGKVIGVTQPRRVAAISVRPLPMSCYLLRRRPLFANVVSLQEIEFTLKGA